MKAQELIDKIYTIHPDYRVMIPATVGFQEVTAIYGVALESGEEAVALLNEERHADCIDSLLKEDYVIKNKQLSPTEDKWIRVEDFGEIEQFKEYLITTKQGKVRIAYKELNFWFSHETSNHICDHDQVELIANLPTPPKH